MPRNHWVKAKETVVRTGTAAALAVLISCGGGGTSDGGFDISAFVGTHSGSFTASLSGGDAVTGTVEITVREDGAVILNFQADNVVTGTAESDTLVIETTVDQILASAGCVVGTVTITLFFGANVPGQINGAINSDGVVVCSGTAVTISGVIQFP